MDFISNINELHILMGLFDYEDTRYEIEGQAGMIPKI